MATQASFSNFGNAGSWNFGAGAKYNDQGLITSTGNYFQRGNDAIVSDEILWNPHSASGQDLQNKVQAAKDAGQRAGVVVTPYAVFQNKATNEQLLDEIQNSGVDFVVLDPYFLNFPGITSERLVEWTQDFTGKLKDINKDVKLVTQGFAPKGYEQATLEHNQKLLSLPGVSEFINFGLEDAKDLQGDPNWVSLSNDYTPEQTQAPASSPLQQAAQTSVIPGGGIDRSQFSEAAQAGLTQGGLEGVRQSRTNLEALGEDFQTYEKIGETGSSWTGKDTTYQVYDAYGNPVGQTTVQEGGLREGLTVAALQFASVVLPAFPGVGSAIGGAITQALGVSASAATNAFIGNTIINTVLNGGDIESAVKGSVASWAGAQAGQMAGEIAKNTFSNPEGIKLISNVASQATQAVIKGGDVESAVKNTLIAGAVDFATAKIPGFNNLPSAVKNTITQSIRAAAAGQDIDAGAMLANAAKEGLLSYGLSQIPQFNEADARTQSFITTMLRSGIDGGDLSESAIKWAVGQAQQEFQKVIKAGPALDELKKAGIIKDASYFGLDDQQKELVDRFAQQKDPKAAAAQYINEQTTTPEEIRQFYKQITGKDATDAEAELLSTFTGPDEATARIGLENQIRANAAADELRFDELNKVFTDPKATDQDLINTMAEYNITPAFIERVTGRKYDEVVRQLDARFMDQEEVTQAYREARSAAGLEPRDPTPDEILRYVGSNAGVTAQIQADVDREATTFDGSTFGSVKSAMEAAKAQGYNSFTGPDGKSYMVHSPVVAIQAGAFDGTTFGSIKSASDAAREAGKTTFVGPDEQMYMVLTPAQEGMIKDQIKDTKTFGQAFADARAKLGPGRTFEWTNPETGETKTYNTYAASELYDGSRAGSKTDAAILAAQNGKTMFQYDGKIWNIPPGSLDNVGNQSRAEARRLVEANATAISNEQAAALEKKLQTKKLGDLDGVVGSVANLFGLSLQGLGEQVQYFATAGAMASGGNINNYYNRVGAAMVQLGEALTSRSLDQQKSSAEAGMRNIAKADFKDQPLQYAQLVKDNFGWWLAENGKEIAQEFAPYAAAVGAGAIALTAGASAPVVAALAAGSSAIVDGLEAFGAGAKEAYETLRKQGVPENYARSQAIKNGLMHALVVTPVEFLADKMTLGALTSSLTGGIKAYMAKNLQATVAQTVGEYIETVGQGLATKITTLDRAMTVDDLKQINVESIFAASLGGGTTASILAGGAVIDAAVVAKDKLGNNVTLQEFLNGSRDVDLSTLNPNAVIGQGTNGQPVTLGSLSAVALQDGFTPATLNASLPSSFTTDNNIVLSRDALGNEVTLGDVFSGEATPEQAKTIIQDYVDLGLSAKAPVGTVAAVNDNGTVTIQNQDGSQTTARTDVGLNVGDSVKVDPNTGKAVTAPVTVVSTDGNTATVRNQDGTTATVTTDAKVGDKVSTNQVNNTATVVDTAQAATQDQTAGTTTGTTADTTSGADTTTAGVTSGATEAQGQETSTVVATNTDGTKAVVQNPDGSTAIVNTPGGTKTGDAVVVDSTTNTATTVDATANTGTVMATSPDGASAVVQKPDGSTTVVNTGGSATVGDTVNVNPVDNTATVTPPAGGVTDGVVADVNVTNGTATVITSDGTKTIVDTSGQDVTPGSVVSVNTSTATVVPAKPAGPTLPPPSTSLLPAQAIDAAKAYAAVHGSEATYQAMQNAGYVDTFAKYVMASVDPNFGKVTPTSPVVPDVTSQADLNAYVVNRFKQGEQPATILQDLYSFGYTRSGDPVYFAMRAIDNYVKTQPVAPELQPGSSSVADIGVYIVKQLTAGKTIDQIKSAIQGFGFDLNSSDITQGFDVAKAKKPDSFVTPAAPERLTSEQVPAQQYSVLSTFPEEGAALVINARDQSRSLVKYQPGMQAGATLELRPQDLGIRDPMTGEIKFGATTGKLATVISRNSDGTFNVQDSSGNIYAVTAPDAKVDTVIEVDPVSRTVVTPPAPTPSPAPAQAEAPTPAPASNAVVVVTNDTGTKAIVETATGETAVVDVTGPVTAGDTVSVDTNTNTAVKTEDTTAVTPVTQPDTSQTAVVVAVNDSGTKAVVETKDGAATVVETPTGVTVGDAVVVDQATNIATKADEVVKVSGPITVQDILDMAMKKRPVDLQYDMNKDGRITAADALLFSRPTSETLAPAAVVVATNDSGTKAVVETSTGQTAVVNTNESVKVGDTVTVDTATNTATKSDVAVEGNQVVNTNTGVAVDTNTGVATNPNTNTVIDTNTGVAVNANTGVAVDTNTGTAVNTNTNTEVNTNTGVATNTNTNTAVDTNTGTAVNPNTNTAVDTNTGAAVNANTGVAVNTNTGVATNTNTNTAVDTNTGVATNQNTNTAVDTNTGVAVNPNTNTAVDTNTNTATTVNPDTNTQTNVDTNTGTATSVNTNTGTQTAVDPTTNTATTVNPDTNTQTATDVATGTTTTVDANTGTQTTVDPTTNTATTVNPSTNTQTDVSTNTGTTTAVDTNTGTQTAVDPTTNTQTTVDPNTNTQTATDVTTGTTTTVNPNTGTTTTVDPTTNTQTIVDPTTNTQTTTDTSTGVTVRPNVDEPPIPPEDPRIKQLQDRIDQLISAGLTQTAATNAAMSELTGQLSTLTQAQTAAEQARQNAANEAARQQRVRTGLSMLTPEAVRSPSELPKVSPLQTSGSAKFISPLAAFLAQVERNEYLPTKLAQPSMTPQARQEPSSYSYGKEPSIDSVLDPYGEQNQEDVATVGFKAGGLATPLFAAGGGTRYGQYAGGGLNVVHHSGKARVDFRRGDAVTGPGDGQSDDIPAMLADGEYVIDSEIVAALGNGSTKAGSELLDEFRRHIRKHKRGGSLDQIPPPSKSPLQYLAMAKKSLNKRATKK